MASKKERAVEAIANAIIKQEISYDELESIKEREIQRFGCEFPSNKDIFEAVRRKNPNALTRFLEKKQVKPPKEIVSDRPLKKVMVINPKIMIVIVAFALSLYHLLFINRNMFIDWDSLAACIDLKNGIPLSRSLGTYHMLTYPLVFLCAHVVAPLVGLDYLLGFKMAILLSVVGGGILLYYTVYQLTKNQIYALLSVMFACAAYAHIFLSLSLDDNIINLFFNMLFIFMFLCQLREITVLEKLSFFTKHSYAMPLITGVALGLATATHINSGLFALLVLSIFIIKKEDPLIDNAKIVGLIALGSVLTILPIVITNAYAYHWDSINDFIGFFSVGYHSDPNLYYFASGYHRDFGRQIEFVFRGLTSTFFGYYHVLLETPFSFLAESKILILILAAVVGGLAFSSRSSKTTLAMVIMILIGFPHTIFYEPWNIERWQPIILPMAVLFGNSLSVVERKKLVSYGGIGEVFTEHGAALMSGLILLMFICSILCVNTLFHFQGNPTYEFADGLDANTAENSLVVVGIRMTSESGLYLMYKSERETISLYDTPVDTVAAYINMNFSDGRSVYATSYALYQLRQSGYNFQYNKVWSNSYCDLYRIYPT